MDAVLEPEVPSDTKSVGGFFKTVFSTSKTSQSEVMNATQFGLLSLAPAYALLRLLRAYVPEPDDSKGSLEISIEVLLQVACMVVGIILIDRAIIYIPTLSGTPYGATPNSLMPLLPFVIVLLTMQTKLGAKVDILYRRITDSQGVSTEQQEYDRAHQEPVPVPDYLPREGFQTQHPSLERGSEQATPQMERALSDSPLSQKTVPDTQPHPHAQTPPDNFSFDQGGNAGSLSFTSF